MSEKKSISGRFRDKKWELYYKRVELARKIRDRSFRLSLKIKKPFWSFIGRIKNRNRPDIFALVKRFFQGFGGGIKYGIKDAINSWKYDRGTILDYDIEVQSLSFHEE